jgi:hypothetical protein
MGNDFCTSEWGKRNIKFWWSWWSGTWVNEFLVVSFIKCFGLLVEHEDDWDKGDKGDHDETGTQERIAKDEAT